jgi:hypothetical protein|tara:strand:- start:152 stop:709 length:558 start_codon:yes stop_codon:yes gene_type:complete
MNYLLILILTLVVLILTTNHEKFSETFGLSGYTKPRDSVKLDDPRPDLSGYKEVEASIDNDMMEEFVLKANKEISKRTGLCTYIIETTSVKHYKGDKKEIYECMFMTMKNGGFSYGFSVVASYEVENGKIRIISLRTQPLGVQAPQNIKPFTEGSEGKEFIKYELVKEVVMPKSTELESVKNKLQ